MIPEILRKPLVFGNKDQLQALKNLEEQMTWCEECAGEGTIQCPTCDGTGKKDEAAGKAGKA
jgi:hypothetical protein